MIGSSSRPTNSSPTSRSVASSASASSAISSITAIAPFMSDAPRPTTVVAVEATGDVPRGRDRVDVAGQQHERRLGAPRRGVGTAEQRRRRPRPSNREGGTSSRSRARIAASSPLSLARSTSSSVRAASLAAEVFGHARAKAARDRPSRRRRAWPDRSGSTSPPSRRSTSTSPPGNRIVTRAGAKPGFVRRDGDRAGAAPAGHRLSAPPLPDPYVDPVSVEARELDVRALGEPLVALERRSDVTDVVPSGVLVDEQHQMGVPHRDRARREGHVRRRSRTADRGTSPTRGRASGSTPA